MKNLPDMSRFRVFEAVIGMGVRECSGCHICLPSVFQENTFLRSSLKHEWGWGGGGVRNPGQTVWQRSVIDLID